MRGVRVYSKEIPILTGYGKSTWIPLGVILLAAIAASIYWLPWVIPLFALPLLFTLWFFRDPERRCDDTAEAVVSPADGKVVEIVSGAAQEPHHVGGSAHKIAIFMSVFDVHVNRSPVEGQVEWLRHEPGKFLNAMKSRASIENEQVLVAMRRDDKPLLLKLIAGLIARRIVCPVQAGGRLARGQRLGMIKFGSRAEVFIPAGERFEIAVRLDQKVKAGQTVLGYWR